MKIKMKKIIIKMLKNKNEFLQNFSRLSKPILYIQLDNKVNDNSNLKMNGKC